MVVATFHGFLWTFFEVIQKRCRPSLAAVISHTVLPCIFSYFPGINQFQRFEPNRSYESLVTILCFSETLYSICSHFPNNDIILFYLKSSFKIFCSGALVET